MSYFLIWGGEDGAQIAEYKNEIELRKALAEDIDDQREVKFISVKEFDPNYCERPTYVLIEGKEIKPKPKKIITDWDFDT